MSAVCISKTPETKVSIVTHKMEKNNQIWTYRTLTWAFSWILTVNSCLKFIKKIIFKVCFVMCWTYEEIQFQFAKYPDFMHFLCFLKAADYLCCNATMSWWRHSDVIYLVNTKFCCFLKYVISFVLCTDT